jgi:hypothetical protein
MQGLETGMRQLIAQTYMSDRSTLSNKTFDIQDDAEKDRRTFRTRQHGIPSASCLADLVELFLDHLGTASGRLLFFLRDQKMVSSFYAHLAV